MSIILDVIKERIDYDYRKINYRHNVLKLCLINDIKRAILE